MDREEGRDEDVSISLEPAAAIVDAFVAVGTAVDAVIVVDNAIARAFILFSSASIAVIRKFLRSLLFCSITFVDLILERCEEDAE